MYQPNQQAMAPPYQPAMAPPYQPAMAPPQQAVPAQQFQHEQVAPAAVPMQGGMYAGPQVSYPQAGYPQAGYPQAQPMQVQMVAPVMQQNNGFDILFQIPSIRVKQKIEWLEAIVGIETKNQYAILDHTNKPIMRAKEDSDFCARQCCPGGCRPYNFDVMMASGEQFLHIDRPFTCTICCFNRPELTVYNSQTNAVIGHISDPWACCDFTFDIFDPNHQKVLRLEGSCCQCGLFCPCPCGPCETVEFAIRDANSDIQVGSLRKTFRFANWTGASDADNYEIDFHGVTHPHWKAMLIALALFLDMNYFESGGAQQRDNSALGQILG